MESPSALQPLLHQAAEALQQAQCLIITAGAGMGVDSGLPDFRGDQGFWTAYPMYQRLGINFYSAANPVHFSRDPAFGWGFYGHRTNLYRATRPHAGFALLHQWARRFALPCFVVTSNVDGQFQQAGFSEDKLLEIHGSIHHLQCSRPCSQAIWPNRETFAIDETSMRCHQVPHCPQCGAVVRPNILMFNDFCWIDERSAAQERALDHFLSQQRQHRHRRLIIELGAGTAVPSIRRLSLQLAEQADDRVVRINPREPQIAAPHLSLPLGALAALQAIDQLLPAG